MRKTTYLLNLLFTLLFLLSIGSTNTFAQICTLSDLTVTYGNCNSDGSFDIIVDFNYDNPTADMFTLSIDGTVYETYPYNSLPIVVSGLSATTVTHTLYAVDIENPDCAVDFLVQTPTCPPTCELVAFFETNTNNFICAQQTVVFVNASTGTNSTDAFYRWYVNNILVAETVNFEYDFPEAGNYTIVLMAQSSSNPDCVQEHVLTLNVLPAIDCMPPACTLSDLTVTYGNCNSDGSFDIIVDFNYTNTSNSFYLLGNGTNYGLFSYADLPITLPFVGDGGIYELIAEDSTNPDCTLSYIEFSVPNCGLAACQITDLVAEAYNCNADGTFDLDLAFNYINTGGIGFDLFVNGVYHSFQTTYPAPYITINNFAPGNGEEITLVVSDNDNSNCFSSYSFIAPLCTTSCGLEASFEYDNSELICAGSTVNFFNSSSAEASYTWHVNGEETPSDSPNLSYTFTEQGIYNVQLSVSNGDCVTAFAIDLNVIGEEFCGTTPPCDGPDCVWPGESNGDGIVYVSDLLSIGMGYNLNGLARTAASTDWLGQPANNWTFLQLNGVNYKHADTNGDGFINDTDISVIDQNYGLVRPDTIIVISETGNNTGLRLSINQVGAPTYVTNPDTGVDEAVYDFAIMLEDTTKVDFIAENIYGLSFEVIYETPVFVNPAIDFNNSWLGLPTASNDAQRIITLNKHINPQNRIDVGLSRIDHLPKSGTGEVCRVQFVVTIDDWPGFKMSSANLPLDLRLQNAEIRSQDNSLLTVNTSTTTNAILSPNPSTLVELTAILEGAYNNLTDNMNSSLSEYELLPRTQPYNTAPWHYYGNENVLDLSDLPNNSVDWVLIEARDAFDPSIIVEQQAGLLLADGRIISTDGYSNGLSFYNLVNNNSYYMIIRHRNHLDIMSAIAATVVSNNLSYNFTTSAAQALGTAQTKEVSVGVFALHAGDFDANGMLSVFDFNNGYLPYQATINQYNTGDLDLNGSVTIADFNLYQSNASLIGISTIRY